MTLNIDLSNNHVIVTGVSSGLVHARNGVTAPHSAEVILTNLVTLKDAYVELEEDHIHWGTDLNYNEIVKHPYSPGNFRPYSELVGETESRSVAVFIHH